MGFLYKAMQRNAGQPVLDEAPTTKSVEPPKPVPVVTLTAQVPVPQPAELPVANPEPVRIEWSAAQASPFLLTCPSRPVQAENLAAVEQWRVLRARIVQVQQSKHIRTLQVTSALQGEGKTVVSANLAFAMAQLNDRKVLLVDADLRNPGVARFLGISEDLPGLAAYLAGSRPFHDCVLKLTEHIHVMPGSVCTESAELLHGNRMAALLRELDAYDLVVFDSPPLLTTADAQILSQAVDACMLVVRADSTSYEQAAQAAAMLGTRSIGAVLNASKWAVNETYYYHHRTPRKQLWSRS